MRTLLEWVLSLFESKSPDQIRIEKHIANKEQELKEIEDEDTNLDDAIARLNK